MEHKAFAMFTKIDENDPRSVTGIAAVIGNVDSGGDRIWKGAFKKSIQEGIERVRHLWQHDSRKPPVATITDLREIGRGELPDEVKKDHPEVKGGLSVSRRYLETPRGDEVLAGIAADPPAINEMSFAYEPVKWDYEEEKDEDGLPVGIIRNLRELRLWDTSDVNWGMNPLTVAQKAVVPFKDTGIADEGEAWSRPTLSNLTDDPWGDLSAAEKRRIASHFAWTKNSPPEAFGDLKLPHHKPGKSGVGPAVWRGVRGAMNVLMGGRGGVDIPSGDCRGIYNHLVKHYEQFDKEPPDFKLVELSGLVTAVLGLPEADGYRLGREILDFEMVELAQAFEIVQRILTAAEPPEVSTADLEALTEQINRRLEIASREAILITGE